MTEPPLCAPPNPCSGKPKNTIPRGACDCHFHVFDAPSPQIPERKYTAPRAPLSSYRKMQKRLGLDRAVVVQPSIYGTDNRTTLRSIPGDGSMKAIVVVDENTTTDSLKEFAEIGVVGIRFNTLFSICAGTDDLATLTKRVANFGWHLQVLMDVSAQPELVDFLATLPVPVVFDHMGHVPSSKEIGDPGFQSLMKHLDTGRFWVKLSGAYRITDGGTENYQDVEPMAEALIAANPDRLVWGSDWPHPAIGKSMPNDNNLLDLLFDWAGNETANKILIDNPEHLYGFPKMGGAQ